MTKVGTDAVDEIAERLAGTAASLDAAMHGFLADLRAFDEAEGWARQGAASFPQWLSWRCGLALGAARERIRVAMALRELPLFDAALRRGELSFSKLRAMTRVATAQNEQALLELGRYATGAQLERICRLYGETRPVEPAVMRERRAMTVQSMGDGTVRIVVRVLAEEAQRVVRACEASADNRLEGLLGMVEETLRGDRPKRTPVDVMVQISAETLEGAGEEGGVSAETARRLLCDGGIVAAMVDGNGETMGIGRKARAIPPPMRRALEARDVTCRFPGCSHRRWCDGHHVKHWARGGETSLANLILLCSFHHKLVHEGGFSIRAEGEGGSFLFADDRGRPVTTAAQRTPWTLPAIDPPTPPDWGGGPIDYHAAVAHLF